MGTNNQSDIQLRITAAIDGLVEIGKLITEVDKLGGQTTESSTEVDKLVTELDKLRQQDKLISEFQDLKKGTADLAGTLDDARTRATTLGKGLADAKRELQQSNSVYTQSKSATAQLADEWQTAKVKLDLLAKGIKESNAPTREQRDELKLAKAEAKALGEQYRSSAKETSALEKGIRATESAVKQQTREFNVARKEVNQLDDQYLKQNGTLNGLRTQLQQAGLNTKQLSAEQRSLKVATEQTEKQVGELADTLRQQKRELDATSGKTEQLAKNMTEAKAASGGFTAAVGGLTSRLLALVGAYLGVQTLKNALVSMFESGDRAEQLSIQLQAVMGSIEGGQQATSWIKDFAKTTPLQLNEVTETFVKLKAMGLDPMDGTMQAVVDQASKLGIGFEGVQSISLALGQAWTKGKLQGEELMQMQERGVPVMDLLAKATGKTTAELTDMASKGLLGRDAIKALIAEMGNQSAGAASAQMGTLTGLLSNLGDTWEEFKTSVANSGALEWLKGQLREMSDTINQMAADGRLKQYAQQVSDWLVTTGQSAKDFVISIGGSFDGMMMATNVTLQSMRVVFNAFSALVRGTAAAILYPVQLTLEGLAKVASAIGQDGIARKIADAADLMKVEFDAFAKATKEDMADIVDSMNIMSGSHTKATDAMTASMQQAKAKSADTAAGIKKDQETIKQAAAEAAKANEDLFQRIGLDLNEMRTGFTKAGQETIDTFQKIAISGQNSSAEIRAAFLKSIDSSATQQEADKLIAIYRQAGRDGAVAAKDLEGGLALASNKTRELTTKTGELGEAYGELGIQSAAALDAIAAKHKVAFEEIQRSGATLDVQREAFLKYAESELKAAKANDRYADASLGARASALGLTDQLEALKTTVGATGKDALITAAALDKLAAKTRAAGDAAADANSRYLSPTHKEWNKRLAESSQSIEDVHGALNSLNIQLSNFDASLGATLAAKSLPELQAQLDSFTASYKMWLDNSNNLGPSHDLFGWIGENELKVSKLNMQLTKSVIWVKQFQDALTNTAAPTTEMIRNAEGAMVAYRSLGAEALSGLRAAIDSAKAKMDSLKDSAQQTLASLRDELDQLDGNYVALEQHRFDAQIADLKAKLAEAQRQSNRQAIADLQESLRIAEQVHQKKLADIKAEAAAQAAASKQAASSTNTSRSGSSSSSTRTIKIDIGGNTTTIDGLTPTQEAQLESMLDQLALAGLRTS